VRANEDAIFEGDSVKERGVVLNLDPGAYSDAEVHIDILADDAIVPDVCPFAYLGQIPDLDTFSKNRLR
jgi:hypothetical protein